MDLIFDLNIVIMCATAIIISFIIAVAIVKAARSINGENKVSHYHNHSGQQMAQAPPPVPSYYHGQPQQNNNMSALNDEKALADIHRQTRMSSTGFGKSNIKPSEVEATSTSINTSVDALRKSPQ